MFKMVPSPRLLQRWIDRIRQYGWYIKVFVGPEELPDTIATLRAISAVPVVIDLMARLKPAPDGARNPAQALVLDLLRRENFWVQLSNGVRMSAQARGRHDVVPVGQALYAAAPDRCLFGTDWPHTHSHNEGGGPPENELIAGRGGPASRPGRQPGAVARIRVSREWGVGSE
jgi:predicted TIM-barrel fold metal-dependent hydrolase